HAPLLSLPAIFGTTLATLPARVPYVFADPEMVKWWSDTLDKETRRQGDKETRRQGDKDGASGSLAPCLPVSLSGFRIGIAWQGNPVHPDDRRRSIPIASFAPLARVVGVQLFSLQKGLGVEQIASVAKRFHVTDLSDRLESFMDTAAVMKNLDLVITIDSAIA